MVEIRHGQDQNGDKSPNRFGPDEHGPHVTLERLEFIARYGAPISQILGAMGKTIARQKVKRRKDHNWVKSDETRGGAYRSVEVSNVGVL